MNAQPHAAAVCERDIAIHVHNVVLLTHRSGLRMRSNVITALRPWSPVGAVHFRCEQHHVLWKYLYPQPETKALDQVSPTNLAPRMVHGKVIRGVEYTFIKGCSMEKGCETLS